MAWKPEYAENRRRKYHADAAERERRLAQSRSGEENREYMREYYQNNKEQFAEYGRANRERTNARKRERYRTDAAFRAECLRLAKLRDPESIRDYRLRKSFGISAREYDEQLELQQGGCAICRAPVGDGAGRRLAVDHDHETGHVRGILCSACNLGLGKFRDDPFLLHRAISYLLAGTLDFMGRSE